MTNQTILHVRGEDLEADEAAFRIRNGSSVAEYHSAVCSDPEDAADEVTRIKQTAAHYSANTVVSLHAKMMDLIEVGDSMAVELALDLTEVLLASHKAFWKSYTGKGDGEEFVLPGADELATLRAGIKQRYDSAVAAQQAAQSAVDALPVEHPLRVTAELFATCVALCVAEASSSVQVAMGELKLEMSDEELEQCIVESAQMVAFGLNISEEKARKDIEEDLGATLEERKASLVAEKRAAMALDRQGTKDGALLAAEKELELIEQGVAMLQAFLNRPEIG